MAFPEEINYKMKWLEFFPFLFKHLQKAMTYFKVLQPVSFREKKKQKSLDNPVCTKYIG